MQKHIAIETRKSPPCTEADGDWNWLMYQQTQGKHNPAYFRDLCSYQIVSCFCGDWYPSRPRDATVLSGGGRRVQTRRAFYGMVDRVTGAIPRLIQWDSWRFWETLVCGAVALHCDLAKAGVILPVMPEAGVHYLACDENGYISSEWLRAERLEQIAAAGQKWAIENYSPSITAKRLLKLLKIEV